MNNAPIAIVAQSCLFPGSLSPQALWKNLIDGQDLLSPPDPARWGVDLASAMGTEGWNNPGGYIHGFNEIFDPARFHLDDALIQNLEPLHRWVIHTAHQAYQQVKQRDSGRLSVILGNLSLPSEGLVNWTEAVWKNTPRPHRLNRFMSGLPAHLVGPALGRKADAFSLDAACASSLYAIKLGCEKLRTNQADLVLAGAVNRADPLFLHIGFQALQALSPTGQSRPFHRDADGLVPAEGAAFIALKRLGDAIHSGDKILGVIHDVGLSNDGRSDGLLVPSGEGQVRAIRSAYEKTAIRPEDLSFIECHATGTALGDGRELKSLQEAFDGQDFAHKIPIGSHKSNMGHAITAAGMAGLLKILGSFEHRQLAPTLHADKTIPELENSPFRLLHEPEELTSERPIAALSAFGFGGNNSHLIVEAWQDNPQIFPGAALQDPASHEKEEPSVAVVGLGLISGVANNLTEFRRYLLDPNPDKSPRPLREVELPLENLRFPPRDLSESLPQQLAILRAAIDAVSFVDNQSLKRTKTGVFTGMQTDPQIVRHGLRTRYAGNPDAQDKIAAPLTTAAVLGALPNIVANRINSHFDFGGYSFATSAEEQSGDMALQIALDAITRGDLDAAIVGAVEITTTRAQKESLEHENLTDAAIVLLLKREDLAQADGDTIFATLKASTTAQITSSDAEPPTIELPHTAHSATGLLQILATIALPDYALPQKTSAAPSGTKKESIITTNALFSPPRQTTILRHPQPLASDAPRIFIEDHQGQQAAIVAASPEEFSHKKARFQAAIDSGTLPGEGVFLFQESPGGEIAQVFTGAASAYHGMGRSLFMAFPQLVENLRARFHNLPLATTWQFHPDPQAAPSPLDKLFASSVLSQIHNALTAEFLKIPFHAAIGFSSGETNALFATGAWTDLDGLMEDFVRSGPFTRTLGGTFDILRTCWPATTSQTWESWRVVGPGNELEAALADEEFVHLILINAPDDFSIGGEPAAIQRVLQSLKNHRASHLEYDIVVHSPEVEHYRDEWIRLHSRETFSTGRRIYSHALLDSYIPTRESAAEALFGQATQTVDFPAMIEKAYSDGIRTFVEHGPRTTLGPWIRQILGDRPHTVVSLDSGSDSSLRPLANALAQLVAAGTFVDIDAFNAQIDAANQPILPRQAPRTLKFPAPKPPTISPTPMTKKTLSMPPAPALPSVYTFANPAPQSAPPAPQQAANPAPQPAPAPQLAMAPTAQQSHLPEYFALQQAAFQRYLQLIATQSHVHQAFLEQSHRAWETFQSFSPPGGDTPSGERGGHAPAQPPFSPPGGDTPSGERGGHAPAQTPEPLPGPKFSRADLEHLASHNISEIFGPIFSRQDTFPRQVRMPEPPLLFADRITGIDAEPGVISTGTIWSETDLTPDSWFLHNGHIPPGVLIEAGQADLLLISWMGADFENKGERIYRLLGCELTYRGGLPKVGDTLTYDIHIDGHANQGPIRLFFFHSDCRVDGKSRLSVRNGQAGFFTDEELKNSGGILWTPEDADFCDNPRLAPPRVDLAKIPKTLSQQAVQALADGNPKACFTTGYERLQTHTRTPNLQAGKMCLTGKVEELAPQGGPFGRGYIRTSYDLTPDSWFFEGHFKNDPCMPGTLMFEATLQVMSLYMIALGFTLDRDGWRFEPVPDTPFQLRCRGQATPKSKQMVYEIFVEEIIDGNQPRLIADVLATIDGLKAFHGRGIQIQLVPDTPLATDLLLNGPPQRDPRALCQQIDGQTIIHDKLAIRATAHGPATLCLGPAYQKFEGPHRLPRLPEEPFQFMTRITEFNSHAGQVTEGASATVEYDIPPDAWYFEENDRPVMPFAILMEAVLQPCGWLSLNSRALLETKEPVHYRNLDGTGTLYLEPTSLPENPSRLTTRTTMTGESRTGAMTIQSFNVQCLIDEKPLFDMDTTFGFFPQKALENQVGLPTTDDERARIAQKPAKIIDLKTPNALFPASLWPRERLPMIDRITAIENDGQTLKIRAEKDIRPDQWFFKAHFFQDPVQPGSLGVEAMIQTLRFALLHQGHHKRFENPIIEPIALNEELTWTYRGQVLPENKLVQILLDLHTIEESAHTTLARASASLWVDGLKIYATENLSLRLVDAP